MNLDNARLPRTFRLSGVLLVLGLLTEMLSLHWIHPLAFMGFIIVGGALLGVGVLLFLYSLLVMNHPTGSADSE
jgi:hypothetical protein